MAEALIPRRGLAVAASRDEWRTASTSTIFAGVTAISAVGINTFQNSFSLPRLEFESPDDYAAILVDSRSRLHSVNNHPAIKFSDGREIFYWHGVEVPDFVVKAPQTITLQHIQVTTNQEIRRVLIERYGAGRYLQDCGAKVVHRDSFGELYRLKQRGDEDIVMVKVKNSTSEPDGTFKDYWLRVPPQTKTAQEGVAWTFRMQEKQYSPEMET